MTSVKWISNANNGEEYERFFKKACDGGHQLLSRYLKPGMSVPVDILSDVQTGAGEKITKPPPIQNVSPTQQTVEIARSELKRENMSSMKKPKRKKKRHSAKESTSKKTYIPRKRKASFQTALEQSLKNKK